MVLEVSEKFLFGERDVRYVTWLVAGWRIGCFFALQFLSTVAVKFHKTSPKSLQVLHPSIGGLRTLVTSKVTALTSPLWCTGIYSWQEPGFSTMSPPQAVILHWGGPSCLCLGSVTTFWKTCIEIKFISAPVSILHMIGVVCLWHGLAVNCISISTLVWSWCD